MMHDIISAYSITCDFKRDRKKAKIRSSQKLPDVRYFRDTQAECPVT